MRINRRSRGYKWRVICMKGRAGDRECVVIYGKYCQLKYNDARRGNGSWLQNSLRAGKASIASACGRKGHGAGAEEFGAAVDLLSTAVRVLKASAYLHRPKESECDYWSSLTRVAAQQIRRMLRLRSLNDIRDAMRQALSTWHPVQVKATALEVEMRRKMPMVF